MLQSLRLLLEFYLLLSPYFLFLLTILGERAPLDAADCFLLLHAALFALRDEPAFTANRAQHTAFDHFLAKALKQRVLRFATA